MQIYVVQPGDTVTAIAAKYHVTIERIIFDNQLAEPFHLAIGQSLLIRDNTTTQNKTLMVSNGYAYPFINSSVLDETLNYLSALSVFSYGFTVEGDLLPPELDDTWMIRYAENHMAKPILTLVPLGPDGKFSNYLISRVINNAQAKWRLIYQLVQKVAEKGFGGVDIDFEYILREDRDTFTQFVRDVAETLNPLGYEVSVALAPKIASDQPGSLYEGKDYGGLGTVANHVLLMTYEWGYMYGPPMAVAPINKVREVVDYAITQIPIKKINLGIPNYGYDWTLPFEQGVSRARTVGNVEAVQIAVANGATIMFDELAKSPYFHYRKDGVDHEVWFEDVRSMKAKFELIKEYGLRGAGYWQIMRLFRANWLLLNDMFYIRKEG